MRGAARPRLLDLFSGAGGAAHGYQRAGFYVVGVDITPQPHYCGDEFIQADALDVLAPNTHFSGRSIALSFDAIHASPPCQGYSQATAWRGNRDEHPRLIGKVRELLIASGLPYVIENVEAARSELRNPTLLCGSMFGLKVERHRYFETNFPLWQPATCNHVGLIPFDHGFTRTESEYRDAMGCGWMTVKEAREAIPPAYTEYIGAALLKHLEVAA